MIGLLWYEQVLLWTCWLLSISTYLSLLLWSADGPIFGQWEPVLVCFSIWINHEETGEITRKLNSFPMKKVTGNFVWDCTESTDQFGEQWHLQDSKSFHLLMWLCLFGKEPVCQCRRLKRLGFDPWVGKIPWRRIWQPTPVLSLRIPWAEEPDELQSVGLQKDTTYWLNSNSNFFQWSFINSPVHLLLDLFQDIAHFY